MDIITIGTDFHRNRFRMFRDLTRWLRKKWASNNLWVENDRRVSMEGSEQLGGLEWAGEMVSGWSGEWRRIHCESEALHIQDKG